MVERKFSNIVVIVWNEKFIVRKGRVMIVEDLFALQDAIYRDFQSKLIPNVPKERIIGVRVPQIRTLAKQYRKREACGVFLQALPHMYYDEDVLHAVLISDLRDYGRCMEAVEYFLPYIDNWAVCDILSPKIFKKNREQLIEKIRNWSASDKVYTCRFGLKMLMAHYLDDAFQEDYLSIPTGVHSEAYYVNMMIAWFFATALAKQWESAVGYLEHQCLDMWVHNKTIQKACESYRITAEQKSYLKTLKR